MNAAQAIAYEQELVAKNVIVAPLSTTAYSTNVADVSDLTFKLRAGTITQAAYNSMIEQYATRDSRDQIEQYLLKPATSQNYNFSISGGNNFSSYFYSASYSKENPYATGNSGDRLTVTLNNTFKLFKTATLTTNLKGSFLNYKNNGVSLSSLLIQAWQHLCRTIKLLIVTATVFLTQKILYGLAEHLIPKWLSKLGLQCAG